MIRIISVIFILFPGIVAGLAFCQFKNGHGSSRIGTFWLGAFET